MFSLYFVSGTKGFIKKAEIAGIILLGLLLVLGSCSTSSADDTNYPGVLPDGLIGTWSFDGTNADRYTIDSDTIKHEMVWESDDYGFTGTISFVSNYSSSSGVIIFEYSSGDFITPGTYDAVYYRDLTPTTVKLADAINLNDFSSSATATLDQAVAKFTRGNWGKFVNWGGVMTQTKE